MKFVEIVASELLVAFLDAGLLFAAGILFPAGLESFGVNVTFDVDFSLASISAPSAFAAPL